MHVRVIYYWLLCYNKNNADVAQLVEQLIRNEQVTGSSPAIGSIYLKEEQ